MGISLALDLLGIALGFLFAVSVFAQAQFVMLLLSALISALAWIQSHIYPNRKYDPLSRCLKCSERGHFCAAHFDKATVAGQDHDARTGSAEG